MKDQSVGHRPRGLVRIALCLHMTCATGDCQVSKIPDLSIETKINDIKAERTFRNSVFCLQGLCIHLITFVSVLQGPADELFMIATEEKNMYSTNMPHYCST